MTDYVERTTRRRRHESHPPERPVDLSLASLQFARHRPTRWLNPDVLVGSGLRYALTSVFGSFLDKRELQANIPAAVDTRYAKASSLWFDYMADTGDGFDSTYTMASLLAQRQLSVDVDGHDTLLPRGQILVLGGDEVYPVATSDNYEQRMSGPFRAALPWSTGDHPSIYALPGNHDWYDGLTGFLRLFGQQRWIGGWTTQQTRSYFALQLPHRWWLWGMDIQSNQYVDEPQLRYFTKVAEATEPGDRLILATAEPSWIETERRPEAYRNLAYVQQALLRPNGIDLQVVLAGDLHHYNRYTRAVPGAPPAEDEPGDNPGEAGGKTSGPAVDNGDNVTGTDDLGPDWPLHLITSGGGGAFLHPTHDLPRHLDLPAAPDGHGITNRYHRTRCYPSAPQSRRLAWAALGLPFRNPGFLWIGAAIQVAFLWTNQFGLRSLSGRPTLPYATSAQRTEWEDMALGLVRNPIAGISLALLAVSLIGLARHPPWTRRSSVDWGVRVVLGLLHTAAHVVALVVVGLVAVRLAADVLSGGWFIVLTSVLAAVIGGLVSSVVVGAYFAATNTIPGLRVHGNEAFSAARLARHRNFLRMRIDEDGSLTIHVIGVDRMVRRWRADTDTVDPEHSWLVPVGRAPEAHVVETIRAG